MKNYRQLIKELPSKTVVFAFGRFNPPTTGHELLIKVVQKLAKSHGADHVIYASRTQDKKKNPLPVDRKIHYLKLMFKGTNFAPATEDERTFIEALKSLNRKYKNVIMVAGSDRIQDYEKILQKYNGKEFHYDTIQVVSAGERDPDSDDATGMSASKMRALAVKGNYTEFKKGLPSTVRDLDGKLLMNEIRTNMGLETIKEQVRFTVGELREKYFKGEIFHVGEIVESNGQQFEIIDRGTNYLTLVDSIGETHKKWIQDCKVVEKLNEDSHQHGIADNQITFKGYTTQNFHHSVDAVRAFNNTIDVWGDVNPATVLVALKATDTYLAHCGDVQCQDPDLIRYWKEAHMKARDSLVRLGEFPDHDDYWYESENVLTPKLKESIDSRVTIDPKSNYNAAKDVMRYKDFKKLLAANQGKIQEDRALHDVVEAEKESGPEIAPTAAELAAKNLEDQGEVHTKVGHTLSANDQLRRMKVKYSRMEQVEHDLKEDLKGSCWKGYEAIGTKKKNGKTVPNCVPMKEELLDEGKMAQLHADIEDHLGKHLSMYKKLGGAEHFANKTQETAKHIAKLHNISTTSAQKHVNDYVDHNLKESAKKSDGVNEDVYTSEFKLKHFVDPETGETKLRKVRPHRVDFAASKQNAHPSQDDKGDDVTRTEQIDDPENRMTRAAKKAKVYPIRDDGKFVGGGNVGKGFDAFFKEEADEGPELDEKDLNHLADSVTEDDVIEHCYDDHEFALVDEHGEVVDDLKEEVILEVLSRMERMKAKIRFARTKTKRERKIQLALKRHSDTKTINSRARRLAVALIKKRFIRKPLKQMSLAEKERAERFVQMRKKAVSRLAMKLVSRIRSVENARLTHEKYTGGSSANVH